MYSLLTEQKYHYDECFISADGTFTFSNTYKPFLLAIYTYKSNQYQLEIKQYDEPCCLCHEYGTTHRFDTIYLHQKCITTLDNICINKPLLKINIHNPIIGLDPYLDVYACFQNNGNNFMLIKNGNYIERYDLKLNLLIYNHLFNIFDFTIQVMRTTALKMVQFTESSNDFCYQCCKNVDRYWVINNQYYCCKCFNHFNNFVNNIIHKYILLDIIIDIKNKITTNVFLLYQKVFSEKA